MCLPPEANPCPSTQIAAWYFQKQRISRKQRPPSTMRSRLAYLTLTDSSQTAADIPEKLVSQAATATAQDSSDTALSNGSSEALPLSNPPESAANQENSSTGKSFGQLFHISVRVPPAFIAALTAILVVIGAVTAGIRFPDAAPPGGGRPRRTPQTARGTSARQRNVRSRFRPDDAGPPNGAGEKKEETIA